MASARSSSAAPEAKAASRERPGERPEPAERGEARALGDEGADEVRVGGLLGRGDALDAHGAVRDAPLLDEAEEEGGEGES